MERANLIEGNPALFEGLGLAHSDGANCRGGSGSANGVTITPGRHCDGADSWSAASSANGSKSGTDDKSNDTGNGKGTGTDPETDDGNGKGSESDDGSGSGKK